MVLFQTQIILPFCETICFPYNRWSFIISLQMTKKHHSNALYALSSKKKNLCFNACLHSIWLPVVFKCVNVVKNVTTREKTGRHWTQSTFVVWKTYVLWNKLMQSWKNMRVNKWWQNMIVWLNYSFRWRKSNVHQNLHDKMNNKLCSRSTAESHAEKVHVKGTVYLKI